MLQQFKSLMLPLAMLAGFLLSDFFSGLGFLTPYLIFLMLVITFCRITPGQMNIKGLHFILLTVQLLVSILIYFLVRPADETAAQGIMICIFAPTATSAVVIAGMLGANLATMATFTFLSNVSAALVAPVVFSFIGTHAEMPFLESFLLIFLRVVPILVIPFAAAFLLMKAAPAVHAKIGKYQMLSFYLWSFALMIVTGQTVNIIKASSKENYMLEVCIACGTFIACVAQFVFGWFIGRKSGDRIAGGQSLGQKNTVLAIWMAQTYLDPVASIGPASYVLWQNMVNSWQLWKKRNDENRV